MPLKWVLLTQTQTGAYKHCCDVIDVTDVTIQVQGVWGNTYPKVGGAGREDHPVRPDELTVSGESDVHQGLLLQQGVHHGEDGGGVVVPFQAELLAHAVTARPHHHTSLGH